MQNVIAADLFFMEDEVKGPGFLTINDGIFGTFSSHLPVDAANIIDYTGKWIAPGLVDTHIHGFGGYDVMEGNFESLNGLSLELLKYGVTSFLPTLLTASYEEILRVSESIGRFFKEVKGAKIQGLYLEGPFFSEKYKGAQDSRYFLTPDLESFNGWQIASNYLIRKIGLAPEVQGALRFIEETTSQGVTAALGHSSATFEETSRAKSKGASVFIHTFNGMSGLHHREPGMVGAALSLEGMYPELICDGHHVSPQSAKILMDSSGRDRVVLVSDAIMAAGMPEGDYHLGALEISVNGGAARLKDGDSLAGSILSLDEAVKNVVHWKIASIEEAIQMASLNPARSCSLEHLCGSIKAGAEADFVVLNDNMTVAATYLNGVLRYSRPDQKEKGEKP